MKKMAILMAVLAIALISAPALAQTISGTPHDLSTRLGTGQVCLSCHAPHNEMNPAAGPLWNHALNKAPASPLAERHSRCTVPRCSAWAAMTA